MLEPAPGPMGMSVRRVEALSGSNDTATRRIR
jgi:hypothetical protein